MDIAFRDVDGVILGAVSHIRIGVIFSLPQQLPFGVGRRRFRVILVSALLQAVTLKPRDARRQLIAAPPAPAPTTKTVVLAGFAGSSEAQIRPEAARELATKDRLLNISVFSSLAFLCSQYGAAMAASKGLMDTQPPILLSLHHKSSAESTPVELLPFVSRKACQKHCMQ